MEHKIKVRISNRHIHLTEKTYHLLFDHELTKRNDLNQIGEFASNETVTIRNGEKVIENVRVVGPLREYDQVEISKRDARFLGINPPVRRSGDLKDSALITIETKLNQITIKGAIIANRHIHMNKMDLEKYGVKNDQKVSVIIGGEKSGIMDAYIKESDNAFLELHVDTDDANAFLLEDNMEVIFRS